MSLGFKRLNKYKQVSVGLW